MARRKTRPVAAPAPRGADINDPPVSRLLQRPGSVAALMPAAWVDPDDIKPDAKHKPAAIAGWRSYDPLRKMAGHPNSGVGQGHILAADKLREQVDLATLGFSALRPLIYVSQFALPRWGLGPAAIAQMRAVRSVRRVVALFSPPQLLLLDAVILRNRTLRAYCLSSDPPASALLTKRVLLLILDRLAEHYDAEIQDEIARGKRLTP